MFILGGYFKSTKLEFQCVCGIGMAKFFTRMLFQISVVIWTMEMASTSSRFAKQKHFSDDHPDMLNFIINSKEVKLTLS
jgi:hypothetical protein